MNYLPRRWLDPRAQKEGEKGNLSNLLPAMQFDEMEKDTIMEAYKFETTVSENGTIQLPEISKFANRKIEVSIVIKQQNGQENAPNAQTPEQFTDKWRGFLKGINPDDSKFRYLSDKFK